MSLIDQLRQHAVPWSHADQVLAAVQLAARCTVQEISLSRLIEPGVDIQRVLDNLTRTNQVVEQHEEVGPPTYTTMHTIKKSMVPVDGDTAVSRVLRQVKSTPGLSARQIGLKLGYNNPGGAVSAALHRLIASGQVHRVITRTQYQHYATGRD